MIARVSLEIALRKEFDYSIPPEFAGQIEVGTRVQVPFGARKIFGTVTALAEESAHAKLKPILKVIGAQSLVTPKVLKLARWISDYYCCAPETALKSVLPEAIRREKDGWKKQLFVRALLQRAAGVSPAEKTSLGILASEKKSGVFRQDAGGALKLPKRQQEVWNIIEERREMLLAELLELAETTAATVRKLENRGLVEITSKISERDPYARETILPTQNMVLNPAQSLALEKIKAAMQRAAGVPPAEPVSPFFNKEADVHKYSGWLPHWRQAQKMYFVTFRLNDSIAQDQLREWMAEKQIWESHHPKPWNEKTCAEHQDRFAKRVEHWLDSGYGSCALRRPEMGALVESALLHFDGARYQLGEYVVMPNHVHVLVSPAEDQSLKSILHSWKSFTAKQANALLKTSGTFWREEYFDHLVRSAVQYEKFCGYIRENPLKAMLSPGTYRLGKGGFDMNSAFSKQAPFFWQDSGSTFLLHGVTGSGKTEIYLQALAHALEQGKGAIVLVPEISLTPQTVERFKARFSSGKLQTLVAVLHSHLSAGERHDEWHKIRQGRARIVIGARSAIFAPVESLGLIIVDEEHETSYKQEEAPRYHARDMAIMRGQMENAVVVLGSATPSLESFYNCKRGKFTLLELPERVDNQKMPRVRVVDMRQAAHKEMGTPLFSPQLKEAINQRLDRGEQTILFLNRRGYSTSLQCPKCGYVCNCPNCSLALTFHRGGQRASGVPPENQIIPQGTEGNSVMPAGSAAARLMCHICGHVEKVPLVCPNEKCKNPAIRFSGTGTQRVEEALAKIFPNARARRMDSDTMRRKDDYRKTLGDFRAGKIDILVGTQMIAKGLHFPNVTLVGIIHADSALHQPDFRAGERTFQLLTQVAGRAGRGDVEGEVFVQAFAPFHPAIQYARRHDFNGFYEQEIEFREQLKYPPVSRVALLTLKGRNEEKVKFSAEHLKRELEKTLKQSSFGGASVPASLFENLDDGSRGRSPHQETKNLFKDLIIAGPAPAPLLRAETFYRYQIMLRTRAMSALSRELARIIQSLVLPEDVTLAVDIDPVNLT